MRASSIVVGVDYTYRDTHKCQVRVIAHTRVPQVFFTYQGRLWRESLRVFARNVKPAGKRRKERADHEH